MNIFKAISAGTAVLAALVGIESGQPSPPFKIGNDWYSISKVDKPK